ncbi:XRE family transcriptional regulator [Actinomadura rupiterrae]|uniref:XRE family transcriptional regulator n=1 Tax=Actinomadura rupiterrae TaxID=559627 RepID=UPI0020A2D202|nr:XRE family transcriptional regulator [Actinomadura rupiterrae]MCP2335023.1 hypothetical protein [Actinomadura rupiterrae]
MSEDGVKPGWAREIRERRLRQCWSQNDLARELEEAADGRTRSQLPARSSIIREIRFHESGRHQPGPVYAELYRRVWERRLTPPQETPDGELPGEHLALAWAVGRLNQRMERRTLLQLATTTAVGAALDPMQRLVKALSGLHRPDDTTISHLEDRTRGFHRLEEHYPAKALYPSLLVHLNEISSLLESGLPERQRRRLAVSAGESAILAAWFAWELKDPRQAAAGAQLANLAARQTGDDAVAACMTGYRTYMTGGKGDRSARLACNALERLGDADPATRAWLLARHAEETSLLGDRDAALRSIREAEDVYQAADPNVRPWTFFLDPARFASMSLTVYSRLRREDDTIKAMDDISVHLGPATEVKKLCVVDAELALGRYRLGDVGEAVNFARSALTATTAMGAPLGWERLDHVAAELTPSRARTAREFRDEYAAVRPKAAQPSVL